MEEDDFDVDAFLDSQTEDPTNKKSYLEKLGIFPPNYDVIDNLDPKLSVCRPLSLEHRETRSELLSQNSNDKMGGIGFRDEDGNIRSVCLEGGVIPFGDDSDVEAFERWAETSEGRAYFGIEEEHYLSDKYPWNPETEMRGDEDDYVDYCEYEKCRYGCYRQFWYQGKYDCCICGVISCKQCARRYGGRTCRDCDAWICGGHKNKKCLNCQDLDSEGEETKEQNEHVEDDDNENDAGKDGKPSSTSKAGKMAGSKRVENDNGSDDDEKKPAAKKVKSK